MANICKNFNSSTNSVQTRVTRVFSEAMRTERNPLVCYYGAIAGLQVRLGRENRIQCWGRGTNDKDISGSI